MQRASFRGRRDFRRLGGKFAQSELLYHVLKRLSLPKMRHGLLGFGARDRTIRSLELELEAPS